MVPYEYPLTLVIPGSLSKRTRRRRDSQAPFGDTLRNCNAGWERNPNSPKSGKQDVCESDKVRACQLWLRERSAWSSPPPPCRPAAISLRGIREEEGQGVVRLPRAVKATTDGHQREHVSPSGACCRKEGFGAGVWVGSAGRVSVASTVFATLATSLFLAQPQDPTRRGPLGACSWFLRESAVCAFLLC